VPERQSREKGKEMKPSTEKEIAGKLREVQGRIEEKRGHLTNDSDLEAEGIGEKIAGKVRKKIDQLEKGIENPLEDSAWRCGKFEVLDDVGGLCLF
jgi:uncharacterized protein YjbJ (UPF0337 family)